MKRARIKKLISPRYLFGYLRHLANEIDAKIFGVDYQQYHQTLRNLVLDGGCESLLDVGCGASSPIKNFSSEIPCRVGVDGHLESIEKSRTAGIHSDYVVSNLLDVGERFAINSFDCVTLLEVIEHFSREDGERILKQCEQIARLKVIVSTPNGFVVQHPEPDNPFMEHISGWSADDFLSRGYQVTGIAGWKHLRGALMRPKWRPHFVFKRISLLTESWFEKRPRHAYQILCVKDVSKSS